MAGGSEHSLVPSSSKKGGEGGPGPAADEDRPASEASGRARVLVVEDEWFVSMEIEAALEGAGYEVVGVAVSADEAVHLAELNKPDVIVMDIRLSGSGDGVDAAIEINQRFGVRSLFVSAHTDSDTRSKAERASPLGWLTKPFSEAQLEAALEAALRSLRH